jgi:hypothetical protein
VSADPNRGMVLRVAAWLGPLQEELVLVGGCVAGILITDANFNGIRSTIDVDLLSGERTYSAMANVSDRLREAGFREDMSEGAPICRWRREELIIDVMPIESEIFGFGNPWYKDALEHAEPMLRAEAPLLRVITAPYFLATKFTAFQDRWKGDFLQSKDFEDIINVIRGRPELIDEIRNAEPKVREFIQSSIQAWLGDPEFPYALTYCVLPEESSKDQIEAALARLRAIAAL